MTSDGKKYGLIVVSAPSGAGKSTLCKKLLAELSSQVALSISTTSRAPRGTEKEGVEYFFVAADRFKEKISKQEFAEWAWVHDNYYGTSKESLERFWSSKRHVLLDIDVQGAESLRNAYPDRCLTVFIAPPSLEVLEQRLRGRGTDAEAVIQKRMTNAKEEMLEIPKFNHVIINESLERAYEELKNVVTEFMSELQGGIWQKRP